MNSLPDAIDSDGDDVIWALQTANTLWKRGEVNEALVWVKRAAKAADEAGDALRALDLQHAVQVLDQARAETASSPNLAEDTDVPASAAAMLLLATTQASPGAVAPPRPATPSPSPSPSPPRPEPAADGPPAAAASHANAESEAVEVDSSALSSIAPAPAHPGPAAAVPPPPPPRPEQRTDPLFTPAFGARGTTSPSLPPPASSDLLEEITDSDVELAPDSSVEPRPAPQAPGPPPPPRKAFPTIAPGRPPPPHPLAVTQVSGGGAAPPAAPPGPPGPPPPARAPAPTRAPQGDPNAHGGSGAAGAPAIPPPARLPSARDAALPPPRGRLPSMPPPQQSDDLDLERRHEPGAAPPVIVSAAPPAPTSSPQPQLSPLHPQSVPPPRPIAETRVDTPLAQVAQVAQARLDGSLPPGAAGPASVAGPGPIIKQIDETTAGKAPSTGSPSAEATSSSASVELLGPASPMLVELGVPSSSSSSSSSSSTSFGSAAGPSSSGDATRSREPAATLPELELELESAPPLSFPLPSVMPVPIDSIQPGRGGLGATTSQSKVATIPPPPGAPGAPEEVVEVDVEVEAPSIERPRRTPRPLTGLLLLNPWALNDHIVSSAPDLDFLTDAERESSLPPEPISLGALDARLRPSSQPDTLPLSDDEIIGDGEEAAALAAELLAQPTSGAPAIAPKTPPPGAGASTGPSPSASAGAPRAPSARPQAPTATLPRAAQSSGASQRAPASGAAPTSVGVPRAPRAPSIAPPRPSPAAQPAETTAQVATARDEAAAPSSPEAAPVVDVEAPRVTPPEPVASRRTHPPPKSADGTPLPAAPPAPAPPASDDRSPKAPASPLLPAVEAIPRPPAAPAAAGLEEPRPRPATEPPAPEVESDPVAAAESTAAPAASSTPAPPRSSAAPTSSGPNSSAPLVLTGDEPFGPLILDSVPAFADLPRDVRRKFANGGRVVELGIGDGTGDFALAYVHRGRVEITAVVHDTPVTTLERGAVLRSRASIEPCPAVRLVSSMENSLVVLWDDTSFSEAFQACTWVEDDLRRDATRPLALVGAITGALSDRLDERHLREVLASLELRVLAPNELLVEQGETVEGVALVGCGELRRVRSDHEPETFPTGAFVLADEVLSASRAKGTVRAGEGGAAVFLLDRKKTQEIVMTYPPVLEILAGM
jgi:hypothetical protein